MLSQRVQARPGETEVVLPDGWVLDGGDVVVVSDDTWSRINDDVAMLRRVLDLGFTAEVPDPVPSFRDIQRAVASSSTGLEDQIDALSVELAAHEADATGVHGIADTAKLAWNQQVDTSASQPGDVLTKNVSGVWVGQPPAGRHQHVQAAPAAQWTVQHNLNRYPPITLRLTANPQEPVHTDIAYVDANTALVTWPAPESGWADC